MDRRDGFYDCIRAIAVLLVLFTHYRGWLPGGSIGVSIFFCLSGFLISRILLRLPDLSPSNIAKFIFRRFMRVWPAMALQITIVLVLMIAVSDHEAVLAYVSKIPGLLTFTTRDQLPWIGASPAILWTLRVEFWFYVFFPVVLWIVGRERILIFALCGIAISWFAKLWLGHASASTPFDLTLVYLDQLMYGAICAWLIENGGAKVRWFYSSAIVSVWLPLAGILMLSTLQFKGFDLQWYLQTSAAAILTTGLILHQWSRPMFGDYEPLATIGRISYSVYLLHAVVFDFFPSHAFPTALQLFVSVGITICASLVTYRWVEQPFIALSKRIARFDSRPDLLVPGALQVERVVRTNRA